MEQPVNELERSEIKKDVLEKYDHSICEMQNEKEIYLKKIEYIQHQIAEMEKNKYHYCKSTGGHTWRTEREQGLYGELFTYCEVCRLGN